MTYSKTLSIGAILGFLGVALGALGAHALKPHLSPDQLSSFVTANRYHLLHAILLVALAFALKNHRSKRVVFSIWAITIGVLLFSGSIYLLTCKDIINLPQLSVLGPVTPLGGLALMAGWAGLAFEAIGEYSKD